MDYLTIDDFADKAGQAFKLTAGEAVLDLTLTSVTPGRHKAPPGAPRAPFSLFFDGTTGRLCPQDTYTLKHETMGALDIFLVPIAANQDGTYRYQAVFA